MGALHPDENLVPVNGVRLLVRDAGAGEPLVLVHGSLDDHRTWRLVEAELARDFRVISYARRGHAGSEDGAAPGLRRDDEDDLAALLGATGLGPVHLVGNSFGASIALGLAARRPDLVRTLCAHEPPLLDVADGDPESSAMRRAIDVIRTRIETGDAEAAVRGFVDGIVLGPGAWDMLGPHEHADMVAAAESFAEELRDHDWAALDTGALARAGFRTLLTTGGQSPAFLRAITRRLVDVAPSAELRTLDGAGHVPHLSHAPTYAATIHDFVTGAAPARHRTPPDGSGTSSTGMRRHQGQHRHRETR